MDIILVTGGLGYIGSHMSVRLIESGFQILILDNLSNSDISMLNKIEKITDIIPKFIRGVRLALEIQIY